MIRYALFFGSIILVISSLFGPFYVGHLMGIEGGTINHWWEMPTVIILFIWCLGGIYIGIALFLEWLDT